MKRTMKYPHRRPLPRKKLLALFLKDIGFHGEASSATAAIYQEALSAAGPWPTALRWKIAVRLLANQPQKLPPQNIGELVEQQHDERTKRYSEESKLLQETVLNRRGDISSFVSDHWNEHGQGPTWNDVSTFLHVPRRVGDKVIKELIKSGTLTASTECHSLKTV